MLDIFTKLNEVIDTYTYWDFGLIIILTTYLLLKYVPFMQGKSENFRVYTNAVVCAVGIFIFSFFWGYEVPKLIISSMCTVAFYQWVVKWIIDKFGVNYNKPTA